MANKVAPKISSPGPSKMPTKGPHNPNVGTHNKGGALAQVKGAPTASPQGRMPLRHPPANITGKHIGQAIPDTAPAATKKPNRKGGAAFYGEA